MVAPKKVSRKAFESFKGERWNAYNELLALSDLAELTPIQRVAHLVYWYFSEVLNGGHFQYFLNKDHFDQIEVIQALDSIGAPEHTGVLTRAWSHFLKSDFDSPGNVEDYLAREAEVDLSGFDNTFWSAGKDFIMQRLEAYLDEHEGEFLEWEP